MSRKILLLIGSILIYLVYPIMAKSENLQQNTSPLNLPLIQEQTDNALVPDPSVAQQLYEASLQYKQGLTTKAEKLEGTRQGQCVVAVREFLGVGTDEIEGVAKNIKTNSQDPQIGAVIKLNMSKLGHIGVVLDVASSTITYYDSNGSLTEMAAIRTISISDPRILGYKIIN